MNKLLVAIVCVVVVVWASVSQSWMELFDNPDTVISVSTMELSKTSPTWQSDTIPNIIHQLAPQDVAYWHPYWEPCHKTWRTMFPDFIHKMWNDQEIDDLIRTRHKIFYEKYKALPHQIQRVNIATYIIMYEYGGVYADMDVECMENFFHVLQPGKANIGMGSGSDEAYENALMASPAKCPFWHYVISDVINTWHIEDPSVSTGARMMTRVVKMLPQNMYSSITNNLLQVMPAGKKGRFVPSQKKDNIVAIHHRTGSWMRN